MATFLENSLFFFMDDAEPVLPIFRSSDYGDPGRIVELTDVGCDTDPTHFPRNAFHRRRGGAESYRSSRRITEWPNERAKKFSRMTATILNNNQNRSGHYTGSKVRRINPDYDYYIDNVHYDSYVKNSYDDELLLKDDPATEYKDTYYTQFVDPRSLIGHSNRKKVSRDTRYNCMRDPEFSPARNIRANRRENASSRQWTTENDLRNFHEDDIRSRRSPLSERKKRTKILSRRDENFNCEEFGNALSNDNFWDSASLGNEVSCEELTLTDQTKLKNRGLQRKTSYNIIDLEREEESEEMRRENLLPEISVRNSKYQKTSTSDGVKEKKLQSNTSNANSPHIQSARPPSGQMSNLNFAGKDSMNMRPRSAVEGKKIGINSPFSSEKRTENSNATFTRTNVDDRQSHINKLSSKTHQPAKTFKRIADSNSNERIYATNEEDHTNYNNNNKNFHSRNSRNNKIDRANMTVSRSAAEEKDEKTFSLKMTSVSPDTEVEKKKKRFFSRLPIRTWKRLRTKEPAALRLESNVINGDDNSKFQAATTNNSKDLKKIKDDEIQSNRLGTKRRNRFGIGSFSAEKPEVTSSNIKNTKGLKDSSMARRTSEQQKKRTSFK